MRNKLKEIVNTALLWLTGCIILFSAACGTSGSMDGSEKDLYELSFVQSAYTLFAGESVVPEISFTKNGKAAPESLLIFSSGDESVAAVNGGTITAVAPGRCAVRAAYGDLTARTAVTVLETPKRRVETDKEAYFLVMGIDGAESVKAEAKAYLKDEEITDAEFFFSSENEEIATVDASGIIAAVKAGKTTVTVTAGGASKSVVVNVLEKATAEEVNTFGEEYVNLFGRTYETANGLKFDHVTSGFEVSFYGTKLTADVEISGTVYARIFLDGDEEGSFQRLQTGSAYALADGLEKGLHTVRVLKSSEIYDGQIVLKGFAAEQFVGTPEKPELKIEFIGDSLTTGYGALGSGGPRTVENSDGCGSFAYYAARKLNADFSMIALQGICVKAYMWQTSLNMADMYPLVSPLTDREYSFDEEADVVVLNLGTNDASYISSKDKNYAARFEEDYADFLRYLRSRHGGAYIVCVYGMMGKNADVDSGIMNAVEKLNDDKISYISSFAADAAGANGHPSRAAHEAAGNSLALYIENLVKSEQNKEMNL